VGEPEGGEVALNSPGIISDTGGVGAIVEVDTGEAVGELESAVALSPPEAVEPSGNVGSISKISSVELSAIPNVESGLDAFPVLPGTKLVPGLSICCICFSTPSFLPPPPSSSLPLPKTIE